MSNKTDKKAQVKGLLDALLLFREYSPDITLATVLTFLEVSKGDGVSGRDIEKALDTNSASAARMLRYFDKIKTGTNEGLDMLDVRIDPHDYRSKTRYLNKKGEVLLDKVLANLK